MRDAVFSKELGSAGWKPALPRSLLVGLRQKLVKFPLSMKNFWLVKQEPAAYSWSDLVKDRVTSWTGVRNYTARNNLRAMSKGDEVLFYHSVTEKAVVGICEVKRSAYPDSTAKEGEWSAVDLIPKSALKRPVTLAEIRANRRLAGIALLRQSRLSVQPLAATEFREIIEMGGGGTGLRLSGH